MKKIFAIISLAALLMPVSCVKDELAGLENGSLTGKGMAFTAVMGDTQSKTVLDTETGNVSWAAGDAIKFDYEIQKQDFEPVVSSNLTDADIKNGAATFYAEIPTVFSMAGKEYNETLEEGATPSRHLYVVYPASVETEYKNSGYTVVIPSVQDGKFESASISLAKWNISEPTAPLDFRNLCGLLQVKVDDEDVRQIKVSSSNNIVGRLNVGFSEKTPLIPYVKEIYQEGASKTITVNVDGAGTYYIAVAPGTEISDFCIALLDGDNNLLGDRVALTETKLSVNRSQILSIGTLGTGTFVTANDGDYFVTPDGRGSGDGSNWANAASFKTFVKEANVHGKTSSGKVKNVYMSEGDYVVTAQYRFDIDNDNKEGIEGFNGFNIWGGYPEDAICCDITRRDIINYPTNIIGSGEGHRLFNIYSGVWGIDGITFKEFNGTQGAVLQILEAGTVNCKNCNFINNTSTTSNGGAVLFTGVAKNAASTFENCSFVGNKITATTASAGSGGAVASVGKAYGAVVKFTKCLFKENSAGYAGGALWARTASYHVEDCNFIDNKSAKGGDALYVDRNNGVAIYCDRSYFSSSTGTMTVICVGNIDSPTTESNASVYLNNCVVAGNWGISSSQIKNLSVGKIVIVNTTLSTQSSTGVLENTDNGSVSVINSIVANTTSSSNGVAFVNKNGKSFGVEYSLYTKYSDTVDVNGSLGGIWVRDIKGNFPTGADIWYPETGSAATLKSNNRTSKAPVDDARENVFYYKWNGVCPEIDGNTFTNTDLKNVTDLVTAADAGFATWLGANSSDPNDNRLGKDIRGNARDAQSMWPGSYQE